MSNTTRPMIRIHNQETNEIIDREMNDEEFAQYQLDQVASAATEAEAVSKAEVKATAEAKLSALGLTTDDLKALLG